MIMMEIRISRQADATASFGRRVSVVEGKQEPLKKAERLTIKHRMHDRDATGKTR
jgi:hypothetical protein